MWSAVLLLNTLVWKATPQKRSMEYVKTSAQVTALRWRIICVQKFVLIYSIQKFKKKNRRNEIASQVYAEELKYMLAKDQICSFVSSFADRPGHQNTW